MPKPKVLKTRDSMNLIDGKVKEKNRIFPDTNKISYENFIIGFQQKYTESNYFHGINIIMSDGQRSKYPLYDKQKLWSDVKINPVGAIVRKVIVFGRPCSEFGGV